MKKYLSIISIYLLLLLFSTCKKYNPDCATCPCPACPIITEVIPNHGRPGDTLILEGNNFHVETELNRIFIGTVAVEEIVEGTNNQLKVIVPQISNSGQVKIKIDDEKALSSDEIPNYNAPHFRLDHFVELVAGKPLESAGDDDGSLTDATFRRIEKMAFDAIHNQIYLIDRNSDSKYSIRVIDSIDVTTVYTFPNTWNKLMDITSTFDNAYLLIEHNLHDSVTSIRAKSINSSIGWPPSIVSSVNNYPLFSIGNNICLDRETANIYYSYGRSSTPLICILKKSLYHQAVDTIARFTDIYNELIIDLEYKNGHIFYFNYNHFSNSYSIIKRQAVAGSNEIVLRSGIHFPGGIAIDSNNKVYYSSQNQIFAIDTNGGVEHIAGSISSGYNDNYSIGLTSMFNEIKDIDFDNTGHLYIVDKGNKCIRRLKIE